MFDGKILIFNYFSTKTNLGNNLSIIYHSILFTTTREIHKLNSLLKQTLNNLHV